MAIANNDASKCISFLFIKMATLAHPRSRGWLGAMLTEGLPIRLLSPGALCDGSGWEVMPQFVSQTGPCRCQRHSLLLISTPARVCLTHTGFSASPTAWNISWAFLTPCHEHTLSYNSQVSAASRRVPPTPKGAQCLILKVRRISPKRWCGWKLP